VGQPAGIKAMQLLLPGKASLAFPLCKICHLGETLTLHLSQYFSVPFFSEITVYLNRSFPFRQAFCPGSVSQLSTGLDRKAGDRVKSKRKGEIFGYRNTRDLTDLKTYDKLLAE